MQKVQENERSRDRTKSKKIEFVLQMFIRCTPSKELFWQTLQRQWSRKISSQIILQTIEERGTKVKCRKCR